MASSLDQMVLAFIAARPDGASLEDLVGANLPGAPARERLVEVTNALLASHSLVLVGNARGGALRWKTPGAREQRTRGLSAEELMVLQHITRAGNTGAWTRDLKARTNLGQPQITKILKALEGKGLTKAVKSVANPSRKLVMLAELEPSKEVTGGAWYTSAQEFDAEFVGAVRAALLRYLDGVGEAPLSQIVKWVERSGLLAPGAKLGREDVQQVLESLGYEGALDAIEVDGGDDIYRRAAAKFPETTALTSVPCGRCPVIDQCRVGGPISPQTCVYFDRWLDF